MLWLLHRLTCTDASRAAKLLLCTMAQMGRVDEAPDATIPEGVLLLKDKTPYRPTELQHRVQCRRVCSSSGKRRHIPQRNKHQDSMHGLTPSPLSVRSNSTRTQPARNASDRSQLGTPYPNQLLLHGTLRSMPRKTSPQECNCQLADTRNPSNRRESIGRFLDGWSG